jgi:Na+/H+ antiporter NhaC
VGGLGWGLGIAMFFSDYFSPLFVGPVMRTLTDKYKISREKLAYICDSTSAPMIALIPFTGWAVYMGGLTVGIGPITDKTVAMDLYIHSIPFNFYSFLAIGLVGLLAMNFISDFGPMRTAENRAKNEGKVLRDGAVPMMGKELTNLEVSTTGNPNIFLNFIVPIMLVVGINLISFIVYGKIAILQSYLTVCTLLAITMMIQKIDNLQGVMKTVMAGMKGVMPAVTILALAFCINTISRELKTAEYVVSLTEEWLLPNLLPMITFLLAGLISFSTGTSWGTYAIMIPIAIPLAFQFTGGEVNTLIYGTFAAIAGGGVFGDHCSPLSDTTVLSSLGSACDHIDHVKTQLLYTLITGGIAMVLYLGIGFIG